MGMSVEQDDEVAKTRPPDSYPSKNRNLVDIKGIRSVSLQVNFRCLASPVSFEMEKYTILLLVFPL